LNYHFDRIKANRETVDMNHNGRGKRSLKTVNSAFDGLADWLGEEIKGWDVINMILSGMLILIISNVLFTVISGYANHELSSNLYSILSIPMFAVHPGILMPVFSFEFAAIKFVNAFIEEVFFRFMFIGVIANLIVLLTGMKIRAGKIILAAAIISSLIFGLAHGGYDRLLFQGVDGMIESAVFIKCGGVLKREGALSLGRISLPFQGLLAVAIVHFSFNYMLYVMQALNSGIYMNYP
jgi:membrane protease YdiL (CAAX protease family)